jgi:Ca-activated chloride channel family protein
VQTYPLEFQSLELTLQSERTIDTISLTSHQYCTTINDGHNASLNYQLYNSQAGSDYQGYYTLAADELGLWAMSTFLDEVPDDYGQGFFTMIVEPDPSSGAQVIAKYFTLIVDVSGSMMGQKIIQARNAAAYIVNHLNPGDHFNIIKFSSFTTSLWPSHYPVTQENCMAALTFITQMIASGSTDIGAAFTAAIPQFETAPDTAASIIIFLTDGQPSTGITDTQLLVNHVHNLVTDYDVALSLFNFGIGGDVNQQLLTLLATDNNGAAQFLGDDELEASITAFYNLIRDPVLLNPVFSVTPEGALLEVYPHPLANLYLGRQMLISGRYEIPQDVTVHFSGMAYNQPVVYNYEVALSDSANLDKQFLTRIWAKQKVEYLLVQYYSYPPNSLEALLIRSEIIQISLDYGIITPFTSFSGGVDNDDETNENTLPAAGIVLKGNFPNPFNPITTIRFEVKAAIHGLAVIKVYNTRGQLVRILAARLDGKGSYEVVWDGKDTRGNTLSSGIYFYTLSAGNHILSGKMTMMK